MMIGFKYSYPILLEASKNSSSFKDDDKFGRDEEAKSQVTEN